MAHPFITALSINRSNQGCFSEYFFISLTTLLSIHTTHILVLFITKNSRNFSMTLATKLLKIGAPERAALLNIQ